MQTALPGPEDIDRLMAFLPRLPTDRASVIENEDSSAGSGASPIPFHYPGYAPVVEEFFAAASAECWSDHEYDPWVVGPQLEESGFVEAADLSQIRTLLTFCVRGERFCDGFWGSMIQEGHIRRILKRLMELRREMA